MKKLLLIVLAVTILKIIVSPTIWHPDINNHVDWGIRFWDYGAAKFYAPETNVWSFTWPNQPPGTTYMFAGIRKVYEGLFNFLSYVHFTLHAFPGSWLLYLEKNMYPGLTKLPAILADIGIAILVYKAVFKITKKEKTAFWGGILWILNPAVWYNSSVWGQYDAVINFLALLAFYLLYQRKLTFAVLAFAFSIYIKASLLIFAPIFLILAIRQRYEIKRWAISVLVTFLTIGLVTLPFSKGEPFTWLFNLYQNKVFTHQLQVITANAFNIWSALTGISEQPQTLPFLGWTYQYWSYIFFAVFYIPVLYLVYKKQDLRSIVWALGTASFAAFMLLTNMHERYIYPLFPYFTILTVLYFNLMANYVGVTLISMLNLYNFWWRPGVPGLMDFMSAQGRLAPRVLGGINFLLFLLLYLRFVKFNLIVRKNK